MLRKKVLAGCLICVATLFLAFTCAMAEEARDISASCKFTIRSDNTVQRLYDGKYTTKWTSKTVKNPNITIQAPENDPAYGIYICFAEMPEQWEIQVLNGENWETYQKGSTDYFHAYVSLSGLRDFRLIVPSDKPAKMVLNQLIVLSSGELPDHVQVWEPTPDKADLMILVAHPDDEVIFMGGMIPTYSVERELDVVVAYMTYANTTRQSELLNGLWSMGHRKYPVIGTLKDRFSREKADAYKIWGEKAARYMVLELMRKYQPEVFVTHDTKGEYGHGAHMVCAELGLFCAKNADNPSIEPELYDIYGGIKPKKVYLHLYPENQIRMDWHKPLRTMGGQTSLSLAQNAYTYHVTQRNTGFTVTDEGPHSNALFGLAFSTVGPDTLGNDIMENIEGKGQVTYVAPAPTPRKAKTDPSESYAWEANWPKEAGTRNEKGYLLAGEFVLADDKNGLWFYATPTLIVRIDRVVDKKTTSTHYEAYLYCDLESEEYVETVLYTPDAPGKEKTQAARIATENQLVFGMNTDYYTYRVASDNRDAGVIIRNTEIIFDQPVMRGRSLFPNLDTLVMYPDGEWTVHYSDEYTAPEYISLGAQNVFSFGPFLVKDGELNPFVETLKFGKTRQPRCALGMIEPGFYYAMLAEGRIPYEAKGITLEALAEHMQAKGCMNALNLDGGQTAVFTFMGKQITRIGEYEDGPNLPRPTSELISVGRSPQIDPLSYGE